MVHSSGCDYEGLSERDWHVIQQTESGDYTLNVDYNIW